MFTYFNPVHVMQGSGCLSALPSVAKEVLPDDGRVLLLAWDSSVFVLEPFQKLQQYYKVQPICFTASNPTVAQLFSLYQQTKEFHPQLVIAVGGGSVMDVGKSLCCFYDSEIETEEQLRQKIETKQYQPVIPWIGVPSTAGTGSEVTCWATIWDPEKGVKRSVESKENYAYAAFADPNITAGLPIGLAASSALDAVAHAVESYWARATNPVSRGLALEAIRQIMGNIDGLLAGAPQAHVHLSYGSLLAGMAFSNTKTTACHSISYPLTMTYGIPHGVAVSLLLAPVFRRNRKEMEVAPLLDALGVEDEDGLKKRIHDIFHQTGISTSLSGWKVPKEALSQLAQRGITKGRADNNPVDLKTEDILQILEEIYDN